jgi:membrane protease YdiL (CAAX protease family)
VTQWVAFAVVTNAVLVVVLALARATQAMTAATDEATASRPGSSGRPEHGPPREDSPDPLAESGSTAAADGDSPAPTRTSDGAGAVGHPGGVPDGADPTASMPADNDFPADSDGGAHPPEDAAPESPTADTGDVDGRGRPGETPDSAAPAHDDVELDEFSTGALLVNVAATHGTLGGILLVAAWFADIPADALGIEAGAAASTGPQAVLYGVALGLALYVANELVAANLDRVGVEYSEDLRDALGPDSLVGWLVLLAVVLPIIAVFEELLFRAALIGVLSMGFGLSPWLLAVLSSVAFGVGHGIQGVGGMIVTGTLGFVLAAGYVLTGSLLVVVIAHYLINALEFLVHEGLGVDWAGAR